jgi:hypothetical protein
MVTDNRGGIRWRMLAIIGLGVVVLTLDWFDVALPASVEVAQGHSGQQLVQLRVPDYVGSRGLLPAAATRISVREVREPRLRSGKGNPYPERIVVPWSGAVRLW